MLSRRGIPCRLNIGVASPAGNVLRAHAWLECGAEIVVGDIEIESYEILWALPME
jgi:Transglutaminase-like superfamily